MYPSKWQVFVAREGGANDCIAQQDTRPTYKELETILKSAEGTSAGKTWVERLRSEFEFNRDSLNL